MDCSAQLQSAAEQLEGLEEELLQQLSGSSGAGPQRNEEEEKEREEEQAEQLQPPPAKRHAAAAGMRSGAAAAAGAGAGSGSERKHFPQGPRNLHCFTVPGSFLLSQPPQQRSLQQHVSSCGKQRFLLQPSAADREQLSAAWASAGAAAAARAPFSSSSSSSSSSAQLSLEQLQQRVEEALCMSRCGAKGSSGGAGEGSSAPQEESEEPPLLFSWRQAQACFDLSSGRAPQAVAVWHCAAVQPAAAPSSPQPLFSAEVQLLLQPPSSQQEPLQHALLAVCLASVQQQECSERGRSSAADAEAGRGSSSSSSSSSAAKALFQRFAEQLQRDVQRDARFWRRMAAAAAARGAGSAGGQGRS